MSAIDYDASRDALYRPALRATVFSAQATVGHDARCAEACRLAYLAFESDAAQRRRLSEALARAGLGHWAGFHARQTGSEAFAALAGDGSAYVVFRGTVPGDFKDLGTDLNARPVPWPKGGRVHAGFAAAFASIGAEIEEWLGQHAPSAPLTLTGHSLGAALATLGMSRWHARRLVTFGCPRVGDAAFAATIARDAAARYVGCCDIVCTVPPLALGYVDAGTPRYIDRSGAVRPDIGAREIAADRAKARSEYLVKHALRPGNVLLRELADHAPINYVRALFAAAA